MNPVITMSKVIRSQINEIINQTDQVLARFKPFRSQIINPSNQVFDTL
jgi:hypothetical protein